MNITLQCHYCGNEDNKLDASTPVEELNAMTIKCKCGRFLIREGIMGHIDNVRIGDKVRHIKKKWSGEVVMTGKNLAEVQFGGKGFNTTYDKSELIVTG